MDTVEKNPYEQLLESIWSAKDTYYRLIPNHKYDFNDYTLDLQIEIKQYCHEHGISLSNVSERF